MPAIGSFLANMLLGGLQEGQRRRELSGEVQKTVLPHLLTLQSSERYRQQLLGIKNQELELKRQALSQKLEGLPDAQFVQLGKTVDANKRRNRFTGFFGGKPDEQSLLLESLYQSELERRLKRMSDLSSVNQNLGSSDSLDFALEGAASANP